MGDRTDLVERIEGKIDRSVLGDLSMTGTGGAVVPRFGSMVDVMEFSKAMATAGVALRKHLRGNVGACLSITMQALRWEMDPFAVANKSYEVNDQLAYESQLVTAVINVRAPIKGRLKTRFEGEGNTRVCIAWATFKDEDAPTEVKSPAFSQISPKNSPLWKTDPDQQLAYYTKRLWARRECPEVLLGIYDREELDDRINERGPDHARDVTPPRPTRADIVAGRVPAPADEWEFTDSDGEVRDFQHPADWAKIFINCLLSPMIDTAHKDGIWETNSPLLARLRELGADGEKLAADVHAANDARLAEEDKRKRSEIDHGRAAAQQDTQGPSDTARKALGSEGVQPVGPPTAGATEAAPESAGAATATSAKGGDGAPAGDQPASGGEPGSGKVDTHALYEMLYEGLVEQRTLADIDDQTSGFLVLNQRDLLLLAEHDKPNKLRFDKKVAAQREKVKRK